MKIPKKNHFLKRTNDSPTDGMLRVIQRAGAWIGYRLTKAYWWVRRPVVLGVRVLITDGNRVLLVRHTYREGWFLPGGSPRANEPLAMTARREAKEEAGIDVEPTEILGVYSTLSQAVNDHVVVFISRIPSSEPFDLDQSRRERHTSEIEALKWVPPQHFSEQTTDQTRYIVKDWEEEKIGAYRIVDR